MGLPRSGWGDFTESSLRGTSRILQERGRFKVGKEGLPPLSGASDFNELSFRDIFGAITDLSRTRQRDDESRARPGYCLTVDQANC